MRPAWSPAGTLIATDDLPCMQVLTTALCVERSSSLLSLSAAAGLARTASLLVWDLPPRSPGIQAGRRAVAVVVLPSGLARGSSFLEPSIRQCDAE